MTFYKMFIATIWFLSIISHSTASLLIDKAAFFANSVFKDFISAVVWWHDNPDDVTEFIQKYEGCVILTPIQNGSNDIIRQINKKLAYRQTVFFAMNVDELEYFIQLINEDLVTPIRIIVVLTKPANFTELTELMETAWKNDVSDMLMVSASEDDVILTTYFPYTNGKCGDITPVHLDHDTKDFFPRKFTNFQGCEIRASLLHMSPYSRLTFENDTLTSISGIDGNILKTLFQVLNASMKVVSAKDHGGTGTIFNGTATGSFGDLVKKKADILCPTLLMNDVRYPYAQFTHAFETVGVYWFGPRRREISEWLRLLQPFLSYTTPALFTASIVFVVVTMTVRRFGLHRSFSRDSILFQSFIVFLGQGVHFITNSWLINSLFLMWIWFCMVVRIAYQGDLVHGLQNTVLESSLGSFETAVETVDGYGSIGTFREVYNGTWYYKDMEIIDLANFTSYLKAVESGKRYLVLSDNLIALDAAPKLQFLSSNPVTKIPVCFYMRPGWPAVADIDHLLYRMIEAGLTAKSLKYYSWEWTRKMIRFNDDRDAKPLTLENVIGGFYLLGVMYVVCFVVFVLEIIYHKFVGKKYPKKVNFQSNKFRAYYN